MFLSSESDKMDVCGRHRCDGSQKKQSLAARAYEQVKRRIVEGTFPPGYPILEGELEKELGISRTPIREAFARLKQEGLIISIRRKGIFVTSLSLGDMQEIQEMLEGLEGVATKLAAERATEEDIRRLEEAVCRQKDALRRDDIEAWAVADEAFHNAILEAARNRRIQAAVSQVRLQWHRQQRLTLRLRPKPFLSTKVHRETLAAIKARDGERARNIDQRHRSEINKILMRILRSVSPTNDGVAERSIA